MEKILPERIRGDLFTVPLTAESFDRPQSLVRKIHPDQKYLRLFYWSHEDSFRPPAEMPWNIRLDSNNNVLLLYYDKRSPSESIKNPNAGLVVCGFSFIEARQVGRYALNLLQLQTAQFHGRDKMEEALLYLNYKVFFAHILEQIAWRLRNIKGQPIDYVTIERNLIGDYLAASSQLGNDNKKRIERKLEEMAIRRTKAAKGMKYDAEVDLLWPTEGRIVYTTKALARTHLKTLREQIKIHASSIKAS